MAGNRLAVNGTSSCAGEFESIRFLTQSRNRVRILRILMEAGGCRRGECQQRLDISRTTVQRNLDAMVERGWVVETADGYTLTTSGHQLITSFDEFAESVRTIDRFQSFLQRVSPQEFPVDVRHLDDAKITVASANDPYAPVERQAQLFQAAHEFRLCTDLLGRSLFERICRRAASRECEGELLLTAGALETLRSDATYAELYTDLTETDRVQVYEYPGQLPYALGIADEAIQISVEDEQHHLQALLETDSPRLREWAEQRYAAHKQRATPVA